MATALSTKPIGRLTFTEIFLYMISNCIPNETIKVKPRDPRGLQDLWKKYLKKKQTLLQEKIREQMPFYLQLEHPPPPHYVMYFFPQIFSGPPQF